MELSEVFTSASLKAADLKGNDVTVTIESVEPKQFKDGNKLVLHFRNTEKMMVCNKTNANRIALSHGSNTNAWVGKKITLYPEYVEFQGDMVEAIRVRPPQRASVAAGNGDGNYELRGEGGITTGGPRNDRSPQPPVRRAIDDPSDDIPF